MAANDLTYELDPTSALAALKKLQKEFAATATAGEDSGKKIGAGLNILINQVDRAVKSQDRLVASVVRQNAAWGQSPIQKVMLDRDRLIKQLGTNETAVKKVTASYDELIRKMNEANKTGGLGPGVVLALRSARDLFEGRTAYGEVMAGKALSTLKGGALAGGITAVGLAAIETVSYSAAKAVAAYGREIHDLQVITGMSAREVQQFSYAAKLSGDNADVAVKLVRGLTQAIEDTSTHGETARKTLAGMGVDLLSLRTGVTPPLQLLQQLSSALETQPNMWLRNQEAIELFKRAGIQSLPMLTELNRNLKEAGGINFISQEQIDHFEEVHRQLTRAETEWDQFVLRIKGSLATPFVVTLQFVADSSGIGGASGGMFGFGNRLPWANKTGGITDPRTGISEDVFGNITGMDMGILKSALSEQVRQTTLTGRPQLAYTDVAQLRAQRARTNPDAARDEANRLKAEYERLANGGLVDRNISWRVTNDSGGFDTKTIRTQVPASAAEVSAMADAYKTADEHAKALVRTEEQRRSILEASRKLIADMDDRTEHMVPANRALLSLFKMPGYTSDDAARDTSIALPTIISQTREQWAENAARALATFKFIGPHNEFATLDSASSIFSQGTTAITRPKWQKFDDQQLREQTQFLTSALSGDLRLRTGEAESSIRLRGLSGPQTPSARLATEREIADVRKSAADEELTAAKSHIESLYADQNTREFALYDARIKYEEEVGKTRQELQHQGAQELRRELDEIKSVTDSLLHTLFTSPSKFGRALGTTLLSAASRPFSNAISSGISSWLQPMIYGTGAQAAMMGGFGGGGSTSGGEGGGGGAGMSLPSGSFSGPVPLELNSVWPRGLPSIFGAGMGGLWGTDNAPGGTGGFVNGSLGLGGGGGRGGGFGGGFGGLGNLTGGFSNLMSTVKSAAGFGNVVTDADGGKWAINGGRYYSIDSVGGKINAFTHSQLARGAAMAGGSYLAQAGILGANRGTGLGVAEATLGGGLIGSAFGGPLGAGIGALVGFGIGVGEMLAGVESPETQAMRLVSSIYHVGISSSMAKQIAGIAQQSYGGMISVAVRSPEVRQLLSLYAAGIGQAFPMSATAPHGASFASSGGSVVQQSTYQYGNPYSYQSSFPVYGGGPTASLSSPGGSGPTYLSLSIGDRAAGAFMDRQFVTPDRVVSNYSAAMKANNGRVQNALNLLDPGSVVS